MTDLAEAARATRRHHVVSAIKSGSFPAWWAEDIPNGKLVAGPFTEILKAQAACDRLNLIAVLDALREPSERMLKAAPASDLKTKFGALYVWRSMIDALIAEVREGRR